MADPTGQAFHTESNFENDFEKLDPLAPSGMDDLVSSTSNVQPDVDLLGGMTGMSASTGPASTTPLLNFDEPAPPKAAEPAFQADPPKPKEPAPAPKPAAEPAKKPQAQPQVSTGGGWLKNIDPRDSVELPGPVLDLIYWRDPKKTGIVFGSMMVLLLSLALFSVLSVVAYLSLAALTVTLSFRVYKNILQAVQKSGDGHPFKSLLEVDIAVPEDKVHQFADHVSKHATANLTELRRLFLVEDLVDSLKFGLLLWVLTYIGAWFNGMTLIILAVITIFTIPKFYETYKTQIDQYIDLARTQIKTVWAQVQEKIPFPGKKKAE